MNKLLRSFVAAAALVVAGASLAQYPNRPIKVVVTIPPGGAPDVAARVVGERLSSRLGQPVVVDNRPGSNGNIAGDVVSKSPPDGYTLILVPDSLITINPHLYPSMPFDTLKGLAPVASVAGNQFMLSVNPSLPVKTLKEFVEYARKANPPLAYASGGHGSQHQFAMELLKARAGIDLVHVPYKGGAPATTATVAGEVAAMFAGSSTAPQIKAGRLRALATTGRKRSAAFPELPTIAETYPGYELTIWLGLFAPPEVPEAIMTRLHNEVNAVLALPEVKEKLNSAGGLEPLSMPLAEFQALIRSDYEKYGKLVKQLNVKVE